MNNFDDPFQEARAKCPIHIGTFQGERIPMILRHQDVRNAAGLGYIVMKGFDHNVTLSGMLQNKISSAHVSHKEIASDSISSDVDFKNYCRKSGRCKVLRSLLFAFPACKILQSI